jgi:hypothetical protein
LAMLVATPFAASAAPVGIPARISRGAGNQIPLSAEGCSGDACIHLSTPSGGQVTIHGCAWKSSFSGHIRISGPSGTGLPAFSSTKTWNSTSHYCTGTDEYFSVTVPAVVGQYCSTSFKGSSYDGTACENVE